MSETNEKLVAMRAAKAEREAAAAAAAEARELAVLELEDRLTTELKGARGEAFEIVETVDGPIAVKLGVKTLFKTFRASKMDEEAAYQFVGPCLLTDVDAFKQIIGNRPGVLDRCATALASLYGVNVKVESGKF